MKDEDILFRLAFSMVNGLGPKDGRTLLSAYGGNVRAVFEDSLLPDGLKLPACMTEKLHDKTLLEAAEREFSFMEKKGVRAVWFEDEEYPARLKECPDAPLLLYVRGKMLLESSHVVSIVGTRRMTVYGRGQTETLVRVLSESVPDLLIVSGLALGVDVCAHRAALALGVPTTAVLGNGFTQIYPPANREVAMEMMEQGALVTELPHNAPIEPYRFLQRNRIIAGMSDACMVMESAVRGGSMSTARLAREYDREVFAVPGRNTDIYSAGCNELILRNVATILSSPEAFVSEMGWDRRPASDRVEQGSLFVEDILAQLPDELREIVSLFEPGEDYTPEQLLQKSGATGGNPPTGIGKLMSGLLQLEIRSMVTSLPGNRYRLM